MIDTILKYIVAASARVQSTGPSRVATYGTHSFVGPGIAGDNRPGDHLSITTSESPSTRHTREDSTTSTNVNDLTLLDCFNVFPEWRSTSTGRH